MDTGKLVDDAFPAPSYREGQREAIINIVNGVKDSEVTVLNAPVGSGKSIMLYTAIKALETSGLITTPLNTLVDQIEEDEFMPDVNTVKGKSNYICPSDGKPTNLCHHTLNKKTDVCGSEYYEDRQRAASEMVATNISFVMSDSIMAEEQQCLGHKGVIVVDECQKIEDFALGFINIELNSRTVPKSLWKLISRQCPNDNSGVEKFVKHRLSAEVSNSIDAYQRADSLTESQQKNLVKYRDLERRIDQYVATRDKTEWTVDTEGNGILMEPINVGYYLHKLLWSRAERVILSSATVPNLGDIGLKSKRSTEVKLPSNFSIKNRPVVIDRDTGKMTKSDREANAPDMAKEIMNLADEHKGEKGLIHCRSYAMMELLKKNLPAWWRRTRAMFQNQSDREGSLEAWRQSSKQVFFSVAMDEGISLDGDDCRWQVLAKTLYKHLGSKRNRAKLDKFGGWKWYNSHAVAQIQQAYGRAVRGPEDYATFYILDTSAVGLIKNQPHLFEPWFLEAVQQHDTTMGVSDIPVRE